MNWVEENTKATEISEAFRDESRIAKTRSGETDDIIFEYSKAKTHFDLIIGGSGWATMPGDVIDSYSARFAGLDLAVNGSLSDRYSKTARRPVSTDVDEDTQLYNLKLADLMKEMSKRKNSLLESTSEPRMLTIAERIKQIIEDRSLQRAANEKAAANKRARADQSRLRKLKDKETARREAPNADVLHFLNANQGEQTEKTSVTVTAMTAFIKSKGRWTTWLRWLKKLR